MRHSLAPVRVLLVLILSGAPAAARGTSSARNDAESLTTEALKLRRAGKDLEALQKLEQAYAQQPSPKAAAQLGLCLQALGRWSDADVRLSEALSASDDPWVAKNKVVLKEQLEAVKTHVARIEVLGEPQGAEVIINGKPAGRLPLPAPVSVDEGNVEIEMRAPGHEDATRSLVLRGGQYQRIPIRLAAMAHAAATDESDTASEHTAAPAVSASAGEAAPPTASGARTVLKWSALGLGALSLAGGVVASVAYLNNVDSFDSYKNEDGSPQCFARGSEAVDAAGVAVGGRCQSALDGYRSAATWAIAGYVGFGVFTAGWLALQLTEPKPEKTFAFSCSPNLLGLSVNCGGTF